MAKEEQTNALAQFAPVGAPVLGVVLAIAFIVAVVMTSSVNENKESLQKTISTVSTRLGSAEVNPPDWGDIPLANTVESSLEPAPRDNWQPASSKPLLKLPVMWQVEMTGPPKDDFQEYDSNSNQFWEREEFAKTPWARHTDPDLSNFDKWDRNPKDGVISRAEYDDKPYGDEAVFRDTLDKDGNDVLTAPDEITEQDVLNWDRYPYDGTIDVDEYKRRFEPREERDLGPVQNIRVAVDPNTMEIVVNWDSPSVQNLPEDVVYYVERFAPESKAARESDYRRRVADYLNELNAWNEAFQAWWNETTENGKTRRQSFPKRDDAEKKFQDETGNAKPVEPPKPGDWEPVTETVGELVNGNEFRDRSFDTEVTYTYAVRMVTKMPPKRGQKADQKLFADHFAYPERQVQSGHPVYVRNRIAMRWWSQQGQTNGTIVLSKWYRIGEEDWYTVRIQQDLAPNDAVGGVYGKAELRDMSARLIDVTGTELGLDVFPDDAKVDFTTNFSYVTNTNRGFLLNSRQLGDFEVPKATKSEATENHDALGMDNPIEIRALTVKNGGKEGTFEVTRWHHVDNQWLRVVWTGAVEQGKAIGGSLDLANPGKDVKIWDASGNQVTRKFEGAVDLAGGTYDELDGRSVVAGGERFDLFGTLYKE